MIEEPQNARSQRTRDAILGATFALLVEGGVASVTMAEVADRAGCSRRALYLHFASRAEILVAMIGYADRRFGLEAYVAPVLEAEGPVERLRALGTFLGAYHTKLAPLLRAVAAERETDEAARAAWEAAMAGWRGNAARIVAELEAEELLHPRFEDPEDAVDLMYSLMSVDLLRVLVDERGWSPEKYGAHMAETFVALLVADAARPHKKPVATPARRRPGGR